jgi:hypothetical protein
MWKDHCTCAIDPRFESYGILFNVNPFVLHTGVAMTRKQDEEWAAYRLERAILMDKCADVPRDGLPSKRKVSANEWGRFSPRVNPVKPRVLP